MAVLFNNHLKHFRGAITLEVFNETDTFESVDILEELWETSHS
jgi:hypothetical protein